MDGERENQGNLYCQHALMIILILIFSWFFIIVHLGLQPTTTMSLIYEVYIQFFDSSHPQKYRHSALKYRIKMFDKKISF